MTNTAEAATEKKPDWEVMLSVINPDQSRPRPRRTSLHTLAYVLGRKDPLELAKELEASGKVLGYVCPDVKTPIFYLKTMVGLPTMIDTRDSSIWGKWNYVQQGCRSLEEFVQKHPFPAVKGFKRFGTGGYWSGSKWGEGTFVKNSSAMGVPYEKADWPYARIIIKALKEAGYEPQLTENDLVELTEPPPPKKGDTHGITDSKEFVSKYRGQQVFVSSGKYQGNAATYVGLATVKGAGPTKVTLEGPNNSKIFANAAGLLINPPDPNAPTPPPPSLTETKLAQATV